MGNGDFNFKKVLVGLLYKDVPDSEPETEPTPTAEQEEAFVSAVTSEGDDVVEMARQLIIRSQDACDNDELSDISNVMKAVETAGSGADHELIRRMLQNLLNLDPDELKQDGINRRDAIAKAIASAKAQDSSLKAEKAEEEQNLRQSEADANSTCTQETTGINTACDSAIEEVKRQAEEQIAALRKQAEQDVEAAKQKRADKLQEIADKREANEAELRRSAQYAEAVEQEGNLAITKIDELLNYLK